MHRDAVKIRGFVTVLSAFALSTGCGASIRTKVIEAMEEAKMQAAIDEDKNSLTVKDLGISKAKGVAGSAKAAIKASPNLAEAHSALGYAIYNGRLDPRSARASYDRSRELGDGDADVLRAFALYCAFSQRPDDAETAMTSSLELDPLNPGAFRAAGYVAYARRDFALTEQQMRAALHEHTATRCSGNCGEHGCGRGDARR